MLQRLNIALLVVLLAPLAHADETFNGRVVGVSDGGTITVLVDKEEIKIRLEGVDAPETGQAFGTQSKKALSDVMFGKDVAVLVTETDQYDRRRGVARPVATINNTSDVGSGIETNSTLAAPKLSCQTV